MSFDPHSLERLKKLGRQLPKEIKQKQTSTTQKYKQRTDQKLHPVEIEENPQQLFRELMEISPDGNVPEHLLERLRALESKNVLPSNDNDLENPNNPDKLSINESLNLYTAFQQLLLEDEI